jgi:two-component system nitrate/nitrite response regulator NarL
MSEKIRVLLVDDHTLFRSGIKSLLQRNDDFEVVGEAGDGLEGIKRARSLKPDVVLLDLHMPGVSGLEAVKVIAEEMPEVRVLMLTVSEDAQDLMDALRAGASGYLLKNIETDALVDAIRRAAQGESVVSQQMTAKLIQGVRNPPKAETAACRARPLFAARARYPGLAGPGREQQGNRPQARSGRKHGQDPCPEHLQEAEHEQPRAGCAIRRRKRLRAYQARLAGPGRRMLRSPRFFGQIRKATPA